MRGSLCRWCLQPHDLLQNEFFENVSQHEMDFPDKKYLNIYCNDPTPEFTPAKVHYDLF